MKHLMSLAGLSVAGLMLVSCNTQVKEANYQVIPLPQEISVMEQAAPFILSDGTKIMYPEGNERMQKNAEFLASYIKDLTGKSLSVQAGTEGKGILLQLGGSSENPEGYQLKVTDANVVISGPTEAGVFYGIQTLRKSIPVVQGMDIALPAVEISDYPRFSYRGAHLDVSRHFFPVDSVKRFIDMLALHNINRFHWHISDDQGWRIEIKSRPELTEIGSKRTETVIGHNTGKYDGQPYGGFYTQEEAKEIVAYAADRHITVIPEIDMPGHMQAALTAYPELGCTGGPYEVWKIWGISDDVLCAGNDETLKFIDDVLGEIIEIFPSEYIHVGGDECPKVRWKTCPKCQARIKALGIKGDKKHSAEAYLQSFIITHAEKFLNDKGRQIIGWDEILEGGLAPNATVLSWRGVEGGLNAAKAGHNAIMAPMPYAYLDFYQEDPEIAPTTIGGYTTLKKTYSYNPVPDDADELVKKHIIGMQGNLWREYMKTSDRVDYQAFPRAMAIAETGWTLDANKNWKSFCERMVTEFERLEVMDTKPCLNFFDVNINTHVDENGPLMVLLETFYPNAEIRYTTDGSEPTYGSTLYEQPFALEGNIDLKAAAFKDGKILGKVTNKPLYGNLLAGKPFTVNYTMGWTGDIFGDNDVLGADKTTFGLTNGKRGNNASYTPWSSFAIVEGKDLEFIVHLDKPTEVRKVVFGSLFNPAMRMLPAGGVAVEVSADGQQYTQIAEKALKHDCPETGRIAFTDSIEFEPTQATFLKVKIKNGGTLRNGVNFEKNNGPEVIPAELWIDEIEAY